MQTASHAVARPARVGSPHIRSRLLIGCGGPKLYTALLFDSGAADGKISPIAVAYSSFLEALSAPSSLSRVCFTRLSALVEAIVAPLLAGGCSGVTTCSDGMWKLQNEVQECAFESWLL